MFFAATAIFAVVDFAAVATDVVFLVLGFVFLLLQNVIENIFIFTDRYYIISQSCF